MAVLNYDSANMRATLRKLIRTQEFDILHLDGVHLAATVSSLLSGSSRRPRIVFNWHNIESEAIARYGQRAADLLHKTYSALNARKLATTERWILNNAFGNIVCSEREKKQLLALVPGARVEVVENGVDVAAFDKSPDAQARRTRLLFVGSMNYLPNVEGAVSFVRNVWPKIHDQRPGWRVTIVGSNPAPEVQALRHDASVEITGTVPDVRPYYHEAVAAIVPLNSGGGTRLKILEAMAAGVPVVSTSLGAEGLEVTDGTNILLVDRDQDWLPALTSLESTQRWEALAAAGRALVRNRYDWRVMGERLCSMYGRWQREVAN